MSDDRTQLSPLVRALLEELEAHPEGRPLLAEALRPHLVPEPAQLLDVDAAAERLGCNPDTLTRWAREKRIWAKKVGREWRFRADRLEVSRHRSSSPLSPLTERTPRQASGAEFRAVEAMKALR